MVILLGHKFTKLCNKLENHNHHHHDHHYQSEDLSESLKVFRSEVSKLINELALDSKPGSEILSLLWIQKCLGILPLINKAFVKLTLEIDYPISKWKVDSIEEYLSYSLCLLDLFNSISSCFSHIEKTKLSLIHALQLFENSPASDTSNNNQQHLKGINPSCLNTKFGDELCKKSDIVRFFSGKELIVNEGVKELKKFGFWVCGILLSGLCSDVKPYIEVKKMAGGFDGSLVFTLDSKISEGLDEKTLILKEVKEVNDAVDCVLGASDEVKNDAVNELKIKVNKFVEVFDAVKSEVDDLFSMVMALRIELIDHLRKQ
ncbi:protein BPS1, chloroplastic-like [Trifolium pratense]|uniref:protein BPS1, chloroplastic-like n=1 Tax=Trifolium pratense TaxID=57577 RepID=UPI001E690FB4|nr:protein BPS1, chloroplastic-like [Trifolium pratense]